MEGNDNQIDWFDGGILDKEGLDLKTINEQNTNENRFVHVQCRDLESEGEYVNNHFWFVPRDKIRATIISSLLNKAFFNNKRKPSVLILAIESLSRLNYLRHMQMTKEAFERLGNVFYLKGLTKMADNSFPNMIPFLTGKIETVAF